MKRLLGLCLVLVLVLSTGCGLLPEEQGKKKSPINKTAVESEYFSVITAEKGDVVDSFSVHCNFGNQKGESYSFHVTGNERTYCMTYVKVGDPVYEGMVLAEVYMENLDEEYDACKEACDAINVQYEYYSKMLGYEQERQKLAKQYGRKYDTKTLDDLTMQFNDYAEQKKIADLKLADADRKMKDYRLIASFDGIVTYVRQMNPWERMDTQPFVSIRSKETGFISWVDDTSLLKLGEIYNLETTNGVVPCELAVMEQDATINTRYNLIFIPVQADIEIEAGTEGTLNIVLKEAKDVVYIPTSALRTIDGKDAVYVVGEDGMRSIRYVEIGLSVTGRVPSDLNRTEIKSGLSVGEKIIVR